VVFYLIFFYLITFNYVFTKFFFYLITFTSGNCLLKKNHYTFQTSRIPSWILHLIFFITNRILSKMYFGFHFYLARFVILREQS
jgi:hypothetical protein